jgi:hypothetical protein
MRHFFAVLLICGTAAGQTTLATFNLTEQFGVAWPVQPLEMKYNGPQPPLAATRMLNTGGTEIPYQWISPANCRDPTAVEGCILVMDGLQPGSVNSPNTQTYTLQAGVAPAAVATNPVTVTNGTCQSGVAGIILANGLGGLCVPRTLSSNFDYAPIQGVELSDGSWTGAAANSPNLFYTNPTTGFLGTLGSYTVTGASWSGGTATLTLNRAAAPGISSGIPVTISGISPSGYNGVFIVTSVSGSTISYAASNPGSPYSSGGSATINGTQNWNSLAGSSMHTAASSLFNSETTSFVDYGPLKTTVQLSYSGVLPYYYSAIGTLTSTTTNTVTFSGLYTDASMVYFYSATHLPAGLETQTVYYVSNCTSASTGRAPPSTCSLSTTPGGAPVTGIGPISGGNPDYVQIYIRGGTQAYATAQITMYANTPGFIVDYDTNTISQWFVPMFMEAGHVFPDLRRYRAGAAASSTSCGYETPLTITNVTNTVTPTVTVSGRLNAANSNQVTISGVNGATGANGTFYACSTSQQNGTFNLYSSATCQCSGASCVAAPGAFSSSPNAIVKPVYTDWNGRNGRDAFYDLATTYSAGQPVYTTAKVPSQTCTATTIADLGADDPANWFGSGFYDMAYNSQGGNSAPVVGIFRGRMAGNINIYDPDATNISLTGWYATPSHFITTAQAFGLEIATAQDNASSDVHQQFGVYIGTVGQLFPADNMQPVGTMQAELAGPNLSSYYSYQLCGPASCYLDPPGGWQYPFYDSTTLGNFETWLGSSTNTTNMINSAGGATAAAAALYTLWNGLAGSTPASAANSAFATLLATPGDGYVQGIGYLVGNASYNPTGVNGSPTVTVVTGPHALQVGDQVLVSFPANSSWNCNSCAVTAISSPTTASGAFSYTPTATPTGLSGYGTAHQLGMSAVVNNLANGTGRWTQAYFGYQLFQNALGNVFPVCTALLHAYSGGASYLTAPNYNMCKTILALAGSLVWDKDYMCIGPDVPIPVLYGASCSGANEGNSNQVQLFPTQRTLASETLNFHPFLQTKVATGIGYANVNLLAAFNSYGAGPASLHYQTNYTEPNYQNFQAGAINGLYSFPHSAFNWKGHIQWLLSGLTPPEPRFGGTTANGFRKCLSNGDGNTESQCGSYAGDIAAGLYPTDPANAGYAQWMFESTNPGSLFSGPPYTLGTYSSFLTIPNYSQLPAVAPALASVSFPGYWSVERFGFGSSHETSVHFINGDFYQSGGHRHIDQGQVSIYAHNAPLAIDWNANAYYPETGAGFCHDRIVKDDDNWGSTSNAMASWSDTTHPIICETSPPSGFTETGVTQPSSSNTPGNSAPINFSAFENSSQSVATFTYADGSTWTRLVRTMAADPVFPLVYVEDQFCADDSYQYGVTPCDSADMSGKTLTWNLMAECVMNGTGATQGTCDPVSTPLGNITPVYSYNFANCGTNETALSYPSNTDTSLMAPYSLANGLERFTFTGMQWPAHETNGIDWDLWEIPSSGSAQFLLGHWAHDCNANNELGEFHQTNKTNPDMGYNPPTFTGTYISNSAQFESQDILRIHDTGTFQTVIAPYRKSETPTRTFVSGSCSAGLGGTVYQMTQGSETTCFNDSAMSFTNGAQQTLTVYDESSQAAFGMTASGGAQELVNDGAGTITWTVDDITAGTRCVTLPAGAWYPSGPVEVMASQYCHYQGASLQPSPSVITFTPTPVTLDTVTLSFSPPAGATAVEVAFGNLADYTALASCGLTCVVEFQLPSGSYSEMHSFLDMNGNVISSSLPRTSTY